MSKIIAPSILNVEKNLIVSSIKEVEKVGAKWIHFDIMDGEFVEARSFSLDEAKLYLENTSVYKDVHLMVVSPESMVENYAKLGAQNLTFHYEACDSENKIKEVIKLIRKNNMNVGISINPETPVSVLKNLIGLVDMVLIMSVYPGKGGQPFDLNTYSKIKELRELSKQYNKNLLIEVDGGIKSQEAKKCFESGANVLVSGTYIFKGPSIKERFEEINEQ